MTSSSSFWFANPGSSFYNDVVTRSLKIDDASNPNGSMDNIAGIFNSKKNILGMMPHPERMVDNLISNKDGIGLFSSLLN